MTGIILLAAGESARLGRPKQLLDWRGKPLLRHAAETAVESGIGPVVVVLGAVDEPCRECLSGLDLTIVRNPKWNEGMGGSIAAGVAAVRGLPLDGAVIMLCDQPFVTSGHIRNLAARTEGHRIVHSFYKNQPGPPAWFSNGYFDRLCALDGNSGAKTLILSEPLRSQIDCPEAAWDVDTPEDLRILDSQKATD